MKNFMAGFLIFLFCFLLFPIGVSAALNLREELLSSVVQIVGVSEDGEVFIGSGTTISRNGLILTNHHVVTDKTTNGPFASLTICYTVSQFKPPRCAATARVIATLEERDLALVMPDKRIGKNGKPTDESFQKFWKRTGQAFYTVPFKNSQKNPLPDILDRITAWGYPQVGGSTVTVTSGFVSGFETEEAEKGKTFIRFIKTDASINPGNSGGAAFNEYFSFIGVPSNAWPGQLGFIIPIQAVVEWLKDLDENGIVDIKKIESMKTYHYAFSDIEAGDSFNDIALLMKHLGIMGSTSKNVFRPDEPLRRAEALRMIIAVKRLSISKTSESCFENMKQEWFLSYVCFAKQNGWIDGKIYNADGYMTEAELSELLSYTFKQILWRSASSDLVTRRKAAQIMYDYIAP